MILAQKNAPSLSDRGKSTFSEGGGDNGMCLKKHECADSTRKLLHCRNFLLNLSNGGAALAVFTVEPGAWALTAALARLA